MRGNKNMKEKIDPQYAFQVTKIEQEKKEFDYIPPLQTADTLFNFVKERKFLEQTIKHKKSVQDTVRKM